MILILILILILLVLVLILILLILVLILVLILLVLQHLLGIDVVFLGIQIVRALQEGGTELVNRRLVVLQGQGGITLVVVVVRWPILALNRLKGSLRSLVILLSVEGGCEIV